MSNQFKKYHGTRDLKNKTIAVKRYLLREEIQINSLNLGNSENFHFSLHRQQRRGSSFWWFLFNNSLAANQVHMLNSGSVISTYSFQYMKNNRPIGATFELKKLKR